MKLDNAIPGRHLGTCHDRATIRLDTHRPLFSWGQANDAERIHHEFFCKLLLLKTECPFASCQYRRTDARLKSDTKLAEDRTDVTFEENRRVEERTHFKVLGEDHPCWWQQASVESIDLELQIESCVRIVCCHCSKPGFCVHAATHRSLEDTIVEDFEATMNTWNQGDGDSCDHPILRYLVKPINFPGPPKIWVMGEDVKGSRAERVYFRVLSDASHDPQIKIDVGCALHRCHDVDARRCLKWVDIIPLALELHIQATNEFQKRILQESDATDARYMEYELRVTNGVGAVIPVPAKFGM
mmetsp:Transcript_60501/g.96059  ORF Transcript_60501/g.96059 Transcript_60501/m.96059 type:complete len:299 (+) Transcript_60501:2886-3782(+)